MLFIPFIDCHFVSTFLFSILYITVMITTDVCSVGTVSPNRNKCMNMLCSESSKIFLCFRPWIWVHHTAVSCSSLFNVISSICSIDLYSSLISLKCLVNYAVVFMVPCIWYVFVELWERYCFLVCLCYCSDYILPVMLFFIVLLTWVRKLKCHFTEHKWMCIPLCKMVFLKSRRAPYTSSWYIYEVFNARCYDEECTNTIHKFVGLISYWQLALIF